MKTLVLFLFPLLLLLGGGLFGWLARWYKYGGRCGAGGLADGVPNVDMARGTVALDGSEPAVAHSAARVSDDARAALGTLKAGYQDGKRSGSDADTPADGSTVAKIGAMAGGAAAAIGAGVASASSTVKETASSASEAVRNATSGAVDATKSSLSSAKDGYAEGKAPGETPDAPADGSVVAKVAAGVAGAVSTVKETASSAGEAVKSAASGAVDATKSSLSSAKDGYVEGKAPGETPDAPADGSVVAKVGAGIGGAVSTVKETASSAGEAVKSATSGAVDATKSSLSSAKDGYVEGKAPGETPDAPADGSVVAKIGAGVGGAVSTVAAATGLAAGRSGDERGAPGATIGQEDGHSAGDIANAEGDLAEPEVDVPDRLSDAEAEAQRLIDSGADVAKPASALTAPHAGRGADDLKRIKGIGPKIESTLNGEGIYYFDQIADFGGRDIAWADRTLAVKGRVVRDRWVPQAQGLALLEPQGQGASGEPQGTGGDAMRTRFVSLSEEAAEDSARGNGMDAGMIDIPESLSDAEVEAQRLIDSGEEVGKPDGALAAPEAGRQPDDLKLISGIGPKIEETLNGEGVYYFDQIADFGGRDLAWADRTLGFRGRVVRDRWIPQARGLAAQPKRGTAPHVADRQAAASDDGASVGPLRLAEAEALRLIEREGGYAATAQNRPDMLMQDGPVSGKPDDLTRIKGIGEKLGGVLNGMGVYYFRQIATFSASDIAWVDSKLKFKGRIIRDRWVPQAEAFEKNRQG